MIIGCGGLAREVYSQLMQIGGWQVTAWRGAPQREDEEIYGLPIIPHEVDQSETPHAFALGNTKERYDLYKNHYADRGYVFPTLIHPTAIIGKNVQVGEGTIISQLCIITCDAEIGRFTYINILSEVAHDCRIGSFVTIGPNCSVNGRTRIGDGTYLGTDVAVRDGTDIGECCLIGMGSVVVKDVPSASLVVGVPGRVKEKLELWLQ